MIQLFSLLISVFLLTLNINEGFQKANASTISSYFDTTVELAIENTQASYSKAQAEQILKRFFEKHQVSSYKKIHEGKKSDTVFVVGELLTKNGKYRTYYVLKDKNGTQRIQQLRIEFDD